MPLAYSEEPGIGIGRTYAIRNTPTHASNQHNTPTIPKFYHLLRARLARHEDTCHIDFKHAIRVFGCVLECGGFLLYACCGDEAIETAFRVGNFFHDLVECGHIADVDLAVVQGGVEVGFRALGDGVEVW